MRLAAFTLTNAVLFGAALVALDLLQSHVGKFVVAALLLSGTIAIVVVAARRLALHSLLGLVLLSAAVNAVISNALSGPPKGAMWFDIEHAFMLGIGFLILTLVYGCIAGLAAVVLIIHLDRQRRQI